MYEEAVQESLFGPDSWYGKTSPEHSAQTKATTSAPSSKKRSGLRNQTRPMFHYLQKESGRWLTAGWGTDGPLLLGAPDGGDQRDVTGASKRQ